MTTTQRAAVRERPILHELKTWPGPFEGVISGDKRHEIRKADRDFSAGDTLRLREWDPNTKAYTGRSIDVAVTYLSPGGSWGLPVGLCVMSIVIERRRRSGETSGEAREEARRG